LIRNTNFSFAVAVMHSSSSPPEIPHQRKSGEGEGDWQISNSVKFEK